MPSVGQNSQKEVRERKITYVGVIQGIIILKIEIENEMARKVWYNKFYKDTHVGT